MNPLNIIGSLTFLGITLVLLWSCQSKQDYTIHIDDISPWCIVSFDSLERTPIDRIEMVKEMGFSRYGYNWKEHHLPIMAEEFELAQANGLEINAIFLWLNAKRDSIDRFSPLNQSMLDIIAQVEKKPALWMSMSENYFQGLTHDEALSVAVEYVTFVKEEAAKMGCEIALYNHQGWFGNPYNEVEIIEAIKDPNLKMVYNFHHAHNDIDDFTEIVPLIIPHLTYINLNGVVKNATKEKRNKILTIGKGDHEAKMIKTLIDNGYDGPWGIIGHIKTEDVEVVLKRNLKGLKKLEMTQD